MLAPSTPWCARSSRSTWPPRGLRERGDVVAEADGVAVVAALRGVLSNWPPGPFAAVHSPLSIRRLTAAVCVHSIRLTARLARSARRKANVRSACGSRGGRRAGLGTGAQVSGPEGVAGVPVHASRWSLN